MEKLGRLLIVTAGILGPALSLAQTPPQTPPFVIPEDQSALRVAYAGRFLGHLRAPDQQRLVPGGCGTQTPNAAAQGFMNFVTKSAPAHDLLLAAGDVLAPDLDGRSVWKDGKRVPKIDFEMTELGPPLEGGFDNVACFLLQAGFDAMVPGKHDFYFGPDRLQDLARYLHLAKGTSILAANLVVMTHTGRPDPNPPPIPSPAPLSKAALAVPHTVLPWLHHLEFEYTGQPDFTEVWLCRLDTGVSAPANPTTASFCQQWLGAAPTVRQAPHETSKMRTAYTAPVTPSVSSPVNAPTSSRAALEVGHYVVYLKVNGQWDSTRTIDVQQPLLQDLTGPEISAASPDVYHLKSYERAGVTYRVAVFGVVDAALRSHIGKLNYSFRPDPRTIPHADRFDTDVQVADPLESLKMALQACAVDAACRGARKVLLAEMARSDALMLGARVNSLPELSAMPPFELVVAQTDSTQQTGEMDSYAYMVPRGGASSPLLVVPDPPVFPVNGGPADLHLGTVEISFEERKGRIEHHRVTKTFDERVTIPDSFLEASPSLSSILNDHPKERVLEVMRSVCNSDIALLQHRDLYDPESVGKFQSNPGQIQDNLDVLLWKGDYVECRSVPGSTLLSLMKTSDQFDQNDLNLLSSDTEKRRGLDAAGIRKQGSDYVTDGQVIDPKTLYSIAITDYLAFGDTGYADLSTSLTPFPIRIPKTGRLITVAEHVCVALQGSTCRGGSTAQQLFTRSQVPPIHPAPGYSGWRHFFQWVKAAAPTRNATEKDAAQQRIATSLTLSTLDFGYSHYFHNRSEPATQALYAGIPQANITAAETSTINSGYALRLSHSLKHEELYFSSLMNYTRVATKDKVTNLNSINQTVNLWRNEVGLNVRVWPWFRNDTGLKWSAAGRSDMQVADPFQELKTKTDDGKGNMVDGLKRIPVPRNYLVLFKTGPRYQNALNWLEAGVETGRNLNSAYRYDFTAPAFSCDLRDATQTLSKCIDTNTTKLGTFSQATTLMAQTATRPILGLYLNFSATIPLPMKYPGWALVVSNQGDFYFPKRGDASVDTRYLDIWSHALQFPVIGSLKFTPKLDMIFYENKVTHAVYRGFNLSFSLHYDFDWHSGLRWKDVLWTTQSNTPRQ